MHCPHDQTPLQPAQWNVFGCRRCEGRLFTESEFSALYPGVRDALLPGDRAGRGRRTACPKCAAAMQPMRLGTLDVWLDVCDGCHSLWIERLEDSVLRDLKARRVQLAAASPVAREGRRSLAQGMATGSIVQRVEQAEEVPTIMDYIDAFLDDLFLW